MKTVIELEDTVGRRLEDFARQQGTTLERLIERAASDFAERLPEPPPIEPRGMLVELPVVHGTRPITAEELRQAIVDADYEDDLRGLGLINDTTPRR